MSQNDPCGGVNFAADDVMTINDVGDESGDGTNLNEDKLVVRGDVGDEVLAAARDDDNKLVVSENGDDEGFGDEILAIDVDFLVAARETQRVEKAMEQLEGIVDTLTNCHAMTTIPLSTDQLERFSRCSFWVDTFSAEMRNVRASAIERKSQLSVRNKKLVVLDNELCWLFAKDCSVDMKEQSLAYVLCHEFIKISRTFRYSSENLISLPLFIRQIFSRDSQQVIHEFSVLAQETLYYIAGWTIHAANNVAPRRSEGTRHCLVYFVNTVCIRDSDSEQRCDLPTGKVDRLIRFGGLRYSTYPYFSLIARI